MKIINKIKDINSNRLIFIGIFLIVCFGLLLGYLSADLYSNLNDPIKNVTNGDVIQLSENSLSEQQLAEDALIIYNRIYTKCDEIVTEEEITDERYTGKTKTELEKIFISWNIVEFSSDKLSLEKRINSYSPDYYKIGIYINSNGENVVAVYSYDVDGKEILNKVTNTPVSLLYDSEIQRLQEGIYTKDQEELYELLENYDE
ncbi:MAG: BofC C-terminal domain-containing protein [Eubacteriaceae bacterium]